jgi:hypothetical protein
MIAAIQGIVIGLIFSFNIFFLRSTSIPSMLVGPVRAICFVGSTALSPIAVARIYQAWSDIDLRTLGSISTTAELQSIGAASQSQPPSAHLAGGRQHPFVAEDEEAQLQRAIQLSLETSRVPHH